MLGWKMSCPKDLKRLLVHSRVSLCRERLHLAGGFSQYPPHGSRTPIELHGKPVEILSSLNERLVGIPIVPDPEQDLQIAGILGLSVRKHRQVDVSELYQFRGIYILFAEIEVDQFDMLVLARILCN